MYQQPVATSAAENLSFLFCGERSCAPEYSFGPAVLEYYILFYCVSGKAVFQAGDREYSVGPRQGVFFLPGELARYQADTHAPCHCIWVAFHGSGAEAALSRCGLSRTNRVYQCKETDALLSCLHQMEEHTKLSFSDEFWLQSLLYQWFALLASAAGLSYGMREPERPGNIYVTKASEYMCRNYQNNITVTELAEYVGLNRSYLTTLFQRQLHISPRGFLMQLRIGQAADLLHTSQFSIGQIAHSCGYPDPLAFSKAFHKLKGCSPSEYRTAIQEKDMVDIPSSN